MSTDPPTDYLARIPLPVVGNDQSVQFYRDPKMEGNADAQLERAIAAIVAIEVERDRAERRAAPSPPPPSASWMSRVARRLADEIDDDKAVAIVAQAIADQVLRGSIPHVAMADRLLADRRGAAP